MKKSMHISGYPVKEIEIDKIKREDVSLSAERVYSTSNSGKTEMLAVYMRFVHTSGVKARISKELFNRSGVFPPKRYEKSAVSDTDISDKDWEDAINIISENAFMIKYTEEVVVPKNAREQNIKSICMEYENKYLIELQTKHHDLIEKVWQNCPVTSQYRDDYKDVVNVHDVFKFLYGDYIQHEDRERDLIFFIKDSKVVLRWRKYEIGDMEKFELAELLEIIS